MSGSGGAWKVAYADFVTAMMAFFLVMWITSQGQDVKQAIAGYFQDPWGTSSELQAPASLLPSEMHGDAQSLTMPEKLPHGKKPGIADSDEKDADARAQSRWAQNHKVQFIQDPEHTSPALVLQFDEASAELNKESLEQLNRFIPVLLGKLNRIEIRGHSTRRPMPGDSPYHNVWQLCFARSAETMKYLEEHGIEPDRVRLSQAGASEPVTNRIESAWQRENSRVEIFLLSEMADEQPGMQKSGQTGAVMEQPEGKGLFKERKASEETKAAPASNATIPSDIKPAIDSKTPTGAGAAPAAAENLPAVENMPTENKPIENKEAALEVKPAASGG
jgi:chemotaxis protein MotB